MTQSAEISFFRDFVDNSDFTLGKSLLTEGGRDIFNGVKFEVGGCLAEVIRKLPKERTEKLLRMAMIKHAVSQILSGIAIKEDNKTSQ